MTRTQRSGARTDQGPAIERRGSDITKQVTARMITPQERAILVESAVISDQLEEAISSRLAASLRDEAIWQYHIGCGRGFVVWARDHSFWYIPANACGGSCGPDAKLGRKIASLIESYDPAHEAVVLAEYANSAEILRICEDGRWSSHPYETGDSLDIRSSQRRWWVTRETNSFRNSHRRSARYNRPVSTTK